MTKRIAACLLLASAAAQAGTGYKCVNADGGVSFQDRPCPREAQSSEFEFRDGYTGDARDATTDKPAPADATDAPPQTDVPPAAPRAPAAEFYACTRPDGEKYYSDDGVSEPYSMPLGVLGYPGSSLDRAYGSRGRLGVSAPELSRPPIAEPGTRSDIAASYVMVQDDCRRLAPAAACAALRNERERIGREARRKFKEERAPLESRLQVLDGKLAGC